MVDYRQLYEQQKSLVEEQQRRISELEAKQRLLEDSFRKVFKLHKELDILRRDCEKRNEESNRFLAEFDLLKDIPSVLPPEPSPPEPKEESLVQTKPSLPLPQVSYDWDEQKTLAGRSRIGIGSYGYRSNGFSSYNFRSLSSSSRSASSRINSDDLKLCLKFDVPSKDLPTKVQLEIRDNDGRIVFQKRQNIYYVKIQERLSTLDSEQDYKLLVRTIEGTEETEEEVVIHNRHYKEPEPEPEPVVVPEPVPEPVITTPAAPLLAPSPSPSPPLRPSPPPPVIEEPVSPPLPPPPPAPASSSPSPILQTLESALQEFLEEAISLETPTPSSVSVSEEDNSVDVAATRRRPSLLMIKRAPQLPADVRYRWQRGFRKAPNGRYVKVPILRVAIDYDRETELLPDALLFEIEDNPKMTKIGKMARHRTYCEFQLPEGQGARVFVRHTTKNTADSYDFNVAEFRTSVPPLEERTLGVWRQLQAELIN